MLISISSLSHNETKAADRTVGSPPGTYATISAAIAAADPGDRLLIEGGVTFYENITIPKNLILQGGYDGCGSGSSATTTVDGSANNSVVVINASLTVTLENLVITNGLSLSEGEGGGVCFAYGTGGGQLTLINVDIHGNRGYWGGGLWVGPDSQVVGTDVNIYDNTADAYGGGVRLYGSSSATFNNSIISDNSAPNGAGLYIDDAASVLNFSGTINDNDATANGGAIYAGSGDLNFSNTIMQGNSANIDGGAIYQSGGTIDFTVAWSIDNNSANGNGGALALSGTANPRFQASGGTGSFISNHADGHGGVAYLHNTSTMQLYATGDYSLDVLNNHAGGDGGAFFADSGGYFDCYGQLVIDGNYAYGNGGAYYLSNGSRVWFDDYVKKVTKIRTNWARNGGAVYAVDSPSVRGDGAEFGDTPVGNYAANGSGGALYLNNSTLRAENCKFYNNRATQNGGAIAASTSTLNIHANLFSAADESLPLAAKIEEDVHETDSDDMPMPNATAVDPLSGEASSLHDNIADSDSDATGYGGAIYTSDSALTLTQTYLHHNSANRGGAVYQTGAGASADVSNCLIHHNTVAAAYGAGIRRENGAFIIKHTTIADNTGGAGFSGLASEAFNCIAWENPYLGFSMTPTVYGCNIDRGGVAGIDVDPKFTAPGDGEDYHLRGISPAIDASCDTGLGVDLENRPRPNGTGFDIGAYEYYRDVVAMPWIPLLLLGD
ncbi:MAG TPA: choice-of-anchor Q domain-containing protein [Syntrophales bacterium]|nr:choice-of-anchor Q domain-containing protein [Syntrophales bacterium]